MYGTREDLCRMLNEQYPAETPLNLIIWTPADIEALADGMEYSFSEHDVRAVLERMDTIPEEQRLESGVSAGLVMALIDQVKENGQRVTVPVDLLETLLITAEQALWDREWTARDRNLPVPESVMRRLADTAKVRALLKADSRSPATRRGDITRTETIMMKKKPLTRLFCVTATGCCARLAGPTLLIWRPSPPKPYPAGLPPAALSVAWKSSRLRNSFVSR